MERPGHTAVTELFSWLKNETAATDSGLMRAVMARSKTLNSSFNSWNAAMGTHRQNPFEYISFQKQFSFFQILFRNCKRHLFARPFSAFILSGFASRSSRFITMN